MPILAGHETAGQSRGCEMAAKGRRSQNQENTKNCSAAVAFWISGSFPSAFKLTKISCDIAATPTPVPSIHLHRSRRGFSPVPKPGRATPTRSSIVEDEQAFVVQICLPPPAYPTASFDGATATRHVQWRRSADDGVYLPSPGLPSPGLPSGLPSPCLPSPCLPSPGRGWPHSPTDIPRRSTAASAISPAKNFTASGHFRRFRRSAKAFPFGLPGTRFWPTRSTPW